MKKEMMIELLYDLLSDIQTTIETVQENYDENDDYDPFPWIEESVLSDIEKWHRIFKREEVRNDG